MGQSESSFMRTYEDTVAQMSSVQLGEIVSRFNELYARAGGPKGHLVDREAFSKYFNVPVAVGDRLFDAFDEKKNGKISFEEFVCGLAVLLHGSFSDKCRLLFQVFNLHEDDGISRSELTTMLSAILQSTNTILYTVAEHDAAVMGGEDRSQTVKKMVDAAFKNCDISRTGKLLPLEFEYWVKRNPKVLDSLLSFKTNEGKCTLGALLQVPMETVSPGRIRKHHSSSPTARPHPPRVQSLPHLTKLDSPTLQMTTVGSEPQLQSIPESHTLPPPLLSSLQEDSSTNRIADEKSCDPLPPPPPGIDAPQPLKDITDSASEKEVKIDIPDIEFSSQGSLSEELEAEETGIEFSTGDESLLTAEGNVEAGIQEVSLQLPAPASDDVIDPTLKSISLDSSRDFTHDPSGLVVDPATENTEGRGLVDMATENTEGRGLVDPATENTEGRGLVDPATENTEGRSLVDPATEETDHTLTGSIMQAEEELTIDIASVPSASSQLGSPVLPTSMSVDVEEEGEEEEGGGGGGEASLQSTSTGGEPLSFGGINEFDDLEDALTASVSESLPETTLAFTPGADTGDSVFDLSISEEVALLTLASHDPGVGSHDRSTSSQQQQPQRRPSPYPEAEGQVSEFLQNCWIPCALTQQLLSHAQPTMATEHLSCPGLTADIKACDPIGELLANHFPDEERKPLLSVEHVSMDADGLKRLVESGCLHAAIELTGRFLSAHGQGLNMAGQPTMHTHKTLQMWLARMSLLVHTEQFRKAEAELDSFSSLDNPDLYYQYHAHSYPGKKGSMVPFSLRLLHAHLPACTGSLPLALDRLCLLQGVCDEVLAALALSRLPGLSEPLSAHDTQIAEALWSERLFKVKCFLGNTFVALQDYSMAVAVYEDILKQQPSLKVEILSGIGRLYLQLGDVATARKHFSRAREAVREGGEEGEGGRSAAVLTNEGLANVFLSKWQAAQECFEEALRMDPGNLMLQNNVTVCVFFQGRLKESISQMESLLRSRPPLSLQPAIFMNLAAAYELESGNSLAKKLNFLPLLGQHVGEGFQLHTLNIK